MTNSLYISTTEAGSGKALVSLGIIDFLLRRTTKVHFFRPLIQPSEKLSQAYPENQSRDEDIDLLVTHFNLRQTYEESYGLLLREANDLIGQHRLDEVIDTIISKFKALESRGDFLLCEGSDYLGENSAFEFSFNEEVVKNLGAPVLILGNAHQRSLEETINPIQLAVDDYEHHGCDIAGVIINKADPEQVERLKQELYRNFGYRGLLLSVIPKNERLGSPRMRDIAAQLEAEVLYGQKRLKNLATNRIVAAMQLQNSLNWIHPDALVITPGDRGDIMAGMLQAHQSSSYPSLAGILLSTGSSPTRPSPN
jgi:phosphate acetyltransferase